MTSLDILFWLLAILLGGIIWAIEAGLAARHRNIVLSSAAATLVTMLYVMFWIDDPSKLMPFDPQKYEKKKDVQSEPEDADDDGEVGEKDVRRKRGGGGTAQKKKKEREEDDGVLLYSRVPFKDCAACPDLVIVPKGGVQVGSPVDEKGREAHERLAVPTMMDKPVAIGRLEILRRDFAYFVGDTGYQSQVKCDIGSKQRGVFNWNNPGFEQDERHPAVCLSWGDVRVYLAWLSGKTDRTYRLPTEIEWEHAARAGTSSPYASGDHLDRRAANVAGSRDGTTVGGLFVQNPWGLSDMVGNVWEMTAECFGQGNQVGAPDPSHPECRRLLKGGAWNRPALAARHAARLSLRDGAATNTVGFRVVRDVDERDAERLLTREQRKQLVDAEKAANAIKAKEEAEIEDAQRKAREEAEAEDKPNPAAPAKP